MPEKSDENRGLPDREVEFPVTEDLVEIARSLEPEGLVDIESLPAGLGFQETPSVAQLREEWLLAMRSGETDWQELASNYRREAEALVNRGTGEAYAKAQIGLDIRMALVRKQAGRNEAYLDDLRDAIEYAFGMGFEEVASELQQALDAELAPEVAELQDPVVDRLVAACEGVLSDEDCEDLRAMPADEAIGFAFALLFEPGIEDPEALLKEKGFLD